MDRNLTKVSPSVGTALEEALEVLLDDVDVSDILLLEVGPVGVVRRGRQESLTIDVDRSLFKTLKEALGEKMRLGFRLEDGHLVHVLSSTGGTQGLGLTVQKRLKSLPALDTLVEEELLSEAFAETLKMGIRAGEGVLVLGHGRGTRVRLAGALARYAGTFFRTAQVDDGPRWEGMRELPFSGDTATAERIDAARAMGVEVFYDPEMHRTGLDRHYATASGIIVIGAVDAPNLGALFSGLDGQGGDLQALSSLPDSIAALAGLVVQVGFTPAGFPTVVAHAPQVVGPDIAPRAPRVDAAPLAAAPAFAFSASPPPPATLPGPTPAQSAVAQYAAPPPPTPDVAAGPPPLAPPSGWSAGPEDLGPGWELGDVPTDLENDIPIPEGIEALAAAGEGFGPQDDPPQGGARGGAFEEVLEKNRTASRPSFMPHPPPVHPQMRDLQADPFGGLTLEPPVVTSPQPDDDAEFQDPQGAGSGEGDKR
jgi:hypothetical protein